jgi:hypothetical protein
MSKRKLTRASWSAAAEAATYERRESGRGDQEAASATGLRSGRRRARRPLGRDPSAAAA